MKRVFSIEKLQHLNKYISKLSQGIDPLTGELFPEDTILNNKNIRDCFNDIRLLLEEQIRIIGDSRFDFSSKLDNKERLITLSDEPVPIGIFISFINEISPSNKRRIRPSEITSWLVKEGILEEYTHADGKVFKKITSKSADFGITSLAKESPSGRKYEVMLYNQDAQRYIMEHINEIIK